MHFNILSRLRTRPIHKFFEQELQQRGVLWSVDADSGRYKINSEHGELLISLDNIVREVSADGDYSRISRFLDTALNPGATIPDTWQEAQHTLFYSLEPNNHEQPAEIRRPLSDCVDQVLVSFNQVRGTIGWVAPWMLTKWGVTQEAAENTARLNLAKALAVTAIETQEVVDVKVGFLNTKFPFKTSLLLAPNLKEVVAPLLGWPLLSVLPDRNFVYLWEAQHQDFIEQVGEVVVREYKQAPYPISTEVWEISDSGFRAIGSFAA